jgi:hypothetical protein
MEEEWNVICVGTECMVGGRFGSRCDGCSTRAVDRSNRHALCPPIIPLGLLTNRSTGSILISSISP